MAGCLDGIRVLELARYQAGPRGGMMLADLGAEVIKIEQLGGESTRKSPPLVNGQSLYFSVYNRGKKSVCLDLRQPEAKDVFFDLLKTADFVLENFKPGTLEEMGLGYSALCAVKPDVILVRVSGFGQEGPYRDRPAFDPVGQAMSGLMTLTGLGEGKPIGTAFSLVDRTASLHATIGALGALRHRERTGEGQVIDVCLLDAALTMVEIPTSYYLSTGKEGGESGRPPYRARDGWVVIAAGPGEMQRKLLQAIGAAAKADEPFSSITSSASPIRKLLAAWCAGHSVTEICETMARAGVVCGPVLTTPQVAKDPHLWQHEMLVKVEDALAGEIYVPGLSIKFSKTPGQVGVVPTPGQHTAEILAALPDYDAARIEKLRAQRAVA